jgi:hypothetical protein
VILIQGGVVPQLAIDNWQRQGLGKFFQGIAWFAALPVAKQTAFHATICGKTIYLRPLLLRVQYRRIAMCAGEDTTSECVDWLSKEHC